MKQIPLLLLFFTCHLVSRPQKNNTIDTTHWKVVHKTRNAFWGNSTYMGAAINFARNKELELNIGRTKGVVTLAGRGMGSYNIRSWGAGYSRINSSAGGQDAVKLFYEYNFFPFIIIGNMGLRGEYIYNVTGKQHYLRPSAGLTLVFLDITYNYSFLLNGKHADNLYRHGLSLRLKYFITKRTWERRYFKRYFPAPDTINRKH